MLYLLEDERKVLNYILKHPEDCTQLRADFFSGEHRAIFKAIKSISKDSTTVNDSQVLAYDKAIKPEVLEAIKKDDCTDLAIPREQVKKAYLVRRKVSEGNNYVIDTYTLMGEEFSMEFDKKTSNEIIKKIRENDIWMDNLSNLDFDPFKGWEYDKIPGSDTPIEWLVDNMFQKGTFNLAIGAAKSGKSQLCYQLAYCMQNGINFFEQKVRKSNVLYVDWELSPKEIKHRIELLDEFYTGPEHKIQYQKPLFVPLFRTNYDINDVVDGIKRTLLLHPEIDVIFYDNFYSFFDGDSNASSAVKQALKSIQSVSTTATIFLVCHTNKADGKDGGSKNGTYAAAGSNAFGGFADEFINIENKVDGRIVRIDGRHISPTQEVACKFCKETYWQFQQVLDESEIHKMITNLKSREDLEEEFPDLAEFIGDDGKTMAQVQKEFPSETVKTMREKGFYLERNKDRIKDGFVCCRWYLVDPRR